MLQFELEFNPDEEISEYSLGNMTVIGENGSLTSSGDSRKLMMLFLSSSILLDGVRKLLVTEKLRTHEFGGISSSFIFEIHKQGQNQFALIDRQRMIAVVSKEELVQTVWRDVNRFYDHYKSHLKSEDSVTQDINLALEDFHKVFASILSD